MIISTYGPDDETLCGEMEPAQNDQEEANDTPSTQSTQGDTTHSDVDPDTTEDCAAETDTEDDFHSPEASRRAQPSPNDSPERDPDENVPDPNSESPSETSSPAQAGPSNRTDQNPP